MKWNLAHGRLILTLGTVLLTAQLLASDLVNGAEPDWWLTPCRMIQTSLREIDAGIDMPRLEGDGRKAVGGAGHLNSHPARGQGVPQATCVGKTRSRAVERRVVDGDDGRQRRRMVAAKIAAHPELPPRRAPAEPGKFDRAKLPPDRVRLPLTSERARMIVLTDMGNEPIEMDYQL